jgi:hypothetical protein
MNKMFCRQGGIWIFLLSLAVMSMAGCGDVDWLPEYKRLPTTPDQFSFPTKTGTEQNKRITSDPITVAGVTAASTPIKVSGSGDSKYSVNGGTETSAEGTVKTGDKVTVSHLSATTVDTATVTTLQIGDVTGKFTSWTRLVDVGTFTTPVPFGSIFEAFALVASRDVNGHRVSITDTSTTSPAQFSVADVNGAPNIFYTPSSGTRTFSTLNGLRIWVRKEKASTTKLIIDDVEYPVVFP